MSVLAARTGAAWVWGETVVLTLLGLLTCRLISPDDPFYAQGPFPWPWLVPVLIALRYGILPGTGAAMVLVFGWFALGGEAETLPRSTFLGGQLLVMICGQYSGSWRTRLRRQNELNVYLDERIERITQRLYLLRLSHDRLEQDFLSRPTTLRDALAALRSRVAIGQKENAGEGARQFLQFLSQFFQIEAAAVHGPAPSFERLASIGEVPPLRDDDSLLHFARERGTTAHVQTAELDKRLPTDHLAIVPITSAAGVKLGLLVITRMPFIGLNEEGLQMVSVIAAAYADALTAADSVMPVLARLPGMPVGFAEEYVKLERLQREFGIASHVVTLSFPRAGEGPDAFDRVRRERRSLDVVWETADAGGRRLLLTLMPLAGTAAVDGYLLRVRTTLLEHFASGFDELGVKVQVVSLGREPLAHLGQALAGTGTAHA